jgi:transcriptional regulator with XRE-family HTH domain
MAYGESRSFGALLRCARLAAGLSQEALAARAGLSAVAISNLERGVSRKPYLETVRLLSTALGLDMAGQAALLRECCVTSGQPPMARA